MHQRPVLSPSEKPGKGMVCSLGTATCMLQYYQPEPAERVVPLVQGPVFTSWLFCLGKLVFWDGLEIAAGRHCMQSFGNQPKAAYITLPSRASALLIQISNGPWRRSDAMPVGQALEMGPRLAYHLQSIIVECTTPGPSTANLTYQLRTMISFSQELLNTVPFHCTLEELQKIKSVELNLLAFGSAIRSIQQLSAKMGIKAYKLKLLIRSIFNCSAQQWLLALKMLYATQLLHQKEITLFYIARQLHYQSDENFITAFRSYFGLTPHVFRKQVSQFHSNLFFETHWAQRQLFA